MNGQKKKHIRFILEYTASFAVLFRSFYPADVRFFHRYGRRYPDDIELLRYGRSADAAF